MMTDGADLAIKLNPSPAEVDAVLQPLVGHNRAVNGRLGFQPFAIHLTDDDVVTGGIVGMTNFDWLIVQYLFVPEARRRQGIGTRLMAEAERFATERGCVGAWLDTFAFQARPFFEGLGYSLVGTIEDHPIGSGRHFLSKRFDGARS